MLLGEYVIGAIVNYCIENRYSMRSQRRCVNRMTFCMSAQNRSRSLYSRLSICKRQERRHR
jgi:hypothetical protein